VVGGRQPATLAHLESVVANLRKGGASFADTGLPAAFAEVESRHAIVMAVEAAMYHEYRLRRHPGDY
jgi:hypothetical protein